MKLNRIKIVEITKNNLKFAFKIKNKHIHIHIYIYILVYSTYNILMSENNQKN